MPEQIDRADLEGRGGRSYPIECGQVVRSIIPIRYTPYMQRRQDRVSREIRATQIRRPLRNRDLDSVSNMSQPRSHPLVDHAGDEDLRESLVR
jgi:hypothetical protein